MKQILEIKHIEDLKKAITVLLSMLNTSKNIILLNGGLGAGKTTFVIEYCKLFNLQASSPTFSVIQDYQNEKIKIAHVDLYRLNDETEVDSVGFWDLFSNSYDIIFIEWSVRINQKDLPIDWNIVNLYFKLISEERRELVINTN